MVQQGETSQAQGSFCDWSNILTEAGGIFKVGCGAKKLGCAGLRFVALRNLGCALGGGICAQRISLNRIGRF
jgi:hypothetical protein